MKILKVVNNFNETLEVGMVVVKRKDCMVVDTIESFYVSKSTIVEACLKITGTVDIDKWQPYKEIKVHEANENNGSILNDRKFKATLRANLIAQYLLDKGRGKHYDDMMLDINKQNAQSFAYEIIDEL